VDVIGDLERARRKHQDALAALDWIEMTEQRCAETLRELDENNPGAAAVLRQTLARARDAESKAAKLEAHAEHERVLRVEAEGRAASARATLDLFMAGAARRNAEAAKNAHESLPATADSVSPTTSTPPETPATGFTFPYATKDLEAMRAAVAQYWEGYTTDKSQPTQKAIGHTLGELLGLPPQANGDPARKAINLAAAIKPDTLPDA
jgi:hypothetical protein